MKDNYVLLVEDQTDVRRMLRSGLESLGDRLKVVDVPSGEEALLVSSRQPIDLLVSDVRLAGITGLELVNKIRLNHPDLKVVIITGLSDPDIRQQVTRIGAQAYFFKPIPMAPFLDSISKILSLEASTEVPTVPLATVALPPKEPQVEDILRDFQERAGARGLTVLDDDGAVQQVLGEGLDVAQFSTLAQGLSKSIRLGQALLPSDSENGPRGVFYYDDPAGCLCLARSAEGIILGVLTDTHAGLGGEALIAETLACVSRLAESPGRLQTPQAGEDGLEQSGESGSPGAPDEMDIEDLFGQSEAGETPVEDVDAYWDAATQSGALDLPGEGTMDYGQARQMGLAIEDDEPED